MSPAKTSSPNRTVLAAGAVVLIVVAVVLALVLGGGSDDTATEDTGGGNDDGEVQLSVSLIPLSGDVRQTETASIEGEPLPRFDAATLPDAAVGTAAPTIVGTYFDGSEARIGFGDGEGAIVLFLAHWCPHCQDEVRSLGRWFEANGVPDDVNIVAVSTDVDNGAPNYPPSNWFLREDWPLPVIRDSSGGDLAKSFGLSGFPFIVVVDADGTVVARQSGGMSVEVWESYLSIAGSGAATSS